DGATAGLGELGGKLQQQRRLADAGLAADQHGGARHDAAAAHAIELGDARADARDLLASLGERLERDHPALGGFGEARARRRSRIRLFDERIPLAAGSALSDPARRHRAAVLAYELASGGPCHSSVLIAKFVSVCSSLGTNFAI